MTAEPKSLYVKAMLGHELCKILIESTGRLLVTVSKDGCQTFGCIDKPATKFDDNFIDPKDLRDLVRLRRIGVNEVNLAPAIRDYSAHSRARAKLAQSDVPHHMM